MPEYLAPGIFIEEINTGPRPIEGVGTSTAIFVGFAPYSKRKQINKPLLVTSWAQYVEAFGRPDKDGRKNPHMEDAYLSYAVQGYFQNGGGRCYVTRVVPPGAPEREASIAIPATGANVVSLIISSATPKPELEDPIEVLIEAPDENSPPGTFTIKALQTDREPQVFKNVSLDKLRKMFPADDDSTDQPVINNPATYGAQSGPENASASASEAEQTADSEADKNEEGDSKGTARKSSARRPNEASASVPAPKAERNRSGLITIEVKEYADIPDIDRAPRFGTYQVEVYQGWPVAEDGLPSREPKLLVDPNEIKGDVLEHTGLQGMEIAEDVTMVCCPDLMSPLVQGDRKRFENQLIKSVQVAMVDHCARLGDRIAILDTPNGLTPQGAKEWRNENANYSDAVAKFAALYYPWVKVDGPNSKPIAVPPCGHIAGVYARSDRTRGVHKAPANEGVLGVTDIAASITKGEQEVLNPLGVNCIRSFPGRGMLVWGARTLSSDPAWRYISVRRLFNYVEKSLERGLQWVVFEPNDPDLWARVRRDVGAFLTNCWRDGMLFGRSPDQAFYVKCDEDLNPHEVRDVGLLIVEIGLAPVKPAEFVVFRFKQWAGGGQ